MTDPALVVIAITVTAIAAAGWFGYWIWGFNPDQAEKRRIRRSAREAKKATRAAERAADKAAKAAEKAVHAAPADPHHKEKETSEEKKHAEAHAHASHGKGLNPWVLMTIPLVVVIIALWMIRGLGMLPNRPLLPLPSQPSAPTMVVTTPTSPCDKVAHTRRLKEGESAIINPYGCALVYSVFEGTVDFGNEDGVVLTATSADVDRGTAKGVATYAHAKEDAYFSYNLCDRGKVAGGTCI